MAIEVPPPEIDEMANEIKFDLFGPTGAVWRLPAKERALVVNAKGDIIIDISVEQMSTPEQKALVHAGPGDALLGLYLSGGGNRDAIFVFADAVRAADMSAADVAIHELGHVFKYNHSSRIGMVANHGTAFMVCEDCELRTVPVSKPFTRNPDCPLCVLDIDLSVVTMRFDGIRQRAHLQHQVPLGLGGLIVDTRPWVADAQKQMASVAATVPWMSKQIATLNERLATLARDIEGMLSPEQVSAAHRLAYRCWDASFDISHEYFLRLFHSTDGTV